MPKELTYHATLFRGWETVRLEYVLRDGQVLMKRKSTWKPQREDRVDLAALTGEVRRVWGRQSAYLVSTVVVVAALLVLGIDAMVHGVGAGGGGIYWPLWGPMLGVALVAGMIRSRTRRSAEWTHFMGVGQGSGLYILKDPRDLKAHDRFVDALKRAAGK